jgi:hypothetical protein
MIDGDKESALIALKVTMSPFTALTSARLSAREAVSLEMASSLAMAGWEEAATDVQRQCAGQSGVQRRGGVDGTDSGS